MCVEKRLEEPLKDRVNVGIIGLGVVGTGVVRILQRHSLLFRRLVGVDIRIRRVADKEVSRSRVVDLPQGVFVQDPEVLLSDPEIDIVVEVMGGYEPARTFVLTALRNGKHVVTANKALLSRYGAEVFLTSQEVSRLVLFEASVGGGIPIIQALSDILSANRIESIYGIINGTCNYILTKMAKEGVGFSDALGEAQRLGFAEADPSLDVDGSDTAHKISILASIAFDRFVSQGEVWTEGISHITSQDMTYANEFGYTIKLLGIAKRRNERIDVRVHPTMIPKGHLLSSIDDEFNAIYVTGDVSGPLMFYGKGAGQGPAASSVVANIVASARFVVSGARYSFLPFNCETKRGEIGKIEDLMIRHYIRLSALDRPGVLAKISGILAKNSISIASVIQKGRCSGDVVPVVMLTHEARDGDMQRALEEIDKLDVIRARSVRIRIEE